MFNDKPHMYCTVCKCRRHESSRSGDAEVYCPVIWRPANTGSI